VGLSGQPTSGIQKTGEPSAHEVGNGGPGGEAPMAGGLGDVPPKTKRGRVAHLSNPATSGAQATGEPKANEGGKTGGQGAKPPWRGTWGGSPHKFKRGGE